MALAKYFEDLLEDVLDGRRWMSESREVRDPARDWTASKQERSFAFSLVHRSGVIWDDRESFALGEEIVAKLSPARADLPVKISWRASRGIQPEITAIGGGIRILAKQVNSGDLVVDCGNYRKAYRLSFTKSHQIDTLPDFSEQVAELIENPLSWSQATFDNFRENIEELLQTHQLPEDFCYGVREFYLGLYHERLHDARFGERLDRAAAMLRPFIAQSRLALMICGYQMYRINEFAHPLASMTLRRLGRAARFFTDGVFAAPSPSTAHSDTVRKTTMLISDADHAMMEAIDAMDRSDQVGFWKRMEMVSQSLSPHDHQGRERFDYLRARVCLETRDLRRAKEYSVNLAQSIVPSFRALAQQAH